MDTKIKRLVDGIIFADFKCTPGEKNSVSFPQVTERKSIDRVAVYVDGYFDVNDRNGKIMVRRQTGHVNSEVGKDIPPGVFDIIAGPEGGRYFCFFPSQSSPRFEHEVIRIKKEEKHVIKKSRLFFLCLGEVIVNNEVKKQTWASKALIDDVEIQAMDDVLAIEMWR
jgi:hypothetical protein